MTAHRKSLSCLMVMLAMGLMAPRVQATPGATPIQTPSVVSGVLLELSSTSSGHTHGIGVPLLAGILSLSIHISDDSPSIESRTSTPTEAPKAPGRIERALRNHWPGRVVVINRR